MTRSNFFVLSAFLGAAVVFGPASAEEPFDREPISYSTAKPKDAVSRLQAKIDSGAARLTFDPAHGYLKSVLAQLHAPVSSQVLVFSKTSLQTARISPQRPRAIYFADDAYIGWVQGGRDLEISVADGNLGTNFYTLSQRDTERPRFVRQTDKCLQCHGSSQTDGIPGHIVRSVFPGKDGNPIFRAGTFQTTQESPFRERWGGWYVTGTHGRMRHMGNVLVENQQRPDVLDREAGANRVDLSKTFPTDPYLTGHSDLAALMVLEHQTRMHNLITQASYATRQALHYQAIMNEALSQPADYQSDATRSRIARACRRLVIYMLYGGEAPLNAPIRGTSGFAKQFSARGPIDSKGRSLYQLDLSRRLMKYPCSYLIYSDAFDALPTMAREQVYRQLHDALTGKDDRAELRHLGEADRAAILGILRETKTGLPDYWK